MAARLFSIAIYLAIPISLAASIVSAQQSDTAKRNASELFPWREVDEAKIRAAGIRKLESRRLVLYTDLAASPEIDELPLIFDQAFDLWCKYFGLDSDRFPSWRMRASLIDQRDRFLACGLIPANLPHFLNGYTLNLECWLHDQTSAYYRRHLLLHEGVHGFMLTLLGNNAPPWYKEGMAEYLGTHRWQGGKLELPYFPQDPLEVPKLGRIEIIQTEFAKARARQFSEVMAYDDKAHLNVESYGWSWAAVAFLDRHPIYRDRFRKLTKLLPTNRDFNAELKSIYKTDFDRLTEEWQIFVADIDYGYDFDRTVIDFKPGPAAANNRSTVTVKADQGWQNSGLRLDAKHRYKVTASGQYQMANGKSPWLSEPQGVSIRYVKNHPLGQLLAVVRPDHAPNGSSVFLKPSVVGSKAYISPQESGTIYFKINDSAGALEDNQGQATVQIIDE